MRSSCTSSHAESRHDPEAFNERLFGRLHARLKSDQIAHIPGQTPVEVDEKIRRIDGHTGNRGEVLGKARACGRPRQIGRKITLLPGRVGERKVLRVRLEKEVERIEHRHLGDQIDFDAQLLGLVRKHDAREIIGFRILLPVDEVPGRLDAHRIGQDARARMRSRPQTHHVRTQGHAPVIPVMRDMIQRNMDRHGPALYGCHRGDGDGTARISVHQFWAVRRTEAGHAERHSIPAKLG